MKRFRVFRAPLQCKHHFLRRYGAVLRRWLIFCGLSTVSEAGNKSITRCTRALSQLKALGFIDYERRWDRVNKQYWPAKIEIRDQLLETVGITEQAWRRAVSQKLNYFNAKNSERLKKAITEADYKRIVIQEQIEMLASEEDGQRDKGKTESSGESCASCSGKGRGRTSSSNH
ncbi:plasmid replication initiator RepA [Escherichia coli]